MEESGTSFNRPYKPFGFNIKVPDIGEKTIQLTEGTIKEIMSSPVEPLFTFLEENEQVFNGDINFEINRMFAQNFSLGSALRQEDEKINGMPPKFDMHF